MIKMKYLLLTCFCCLMISSDVLSQDFDSAVGLRLGYPTSVTYKKFINETAAIEGYVGFRSFAGASYLSVNGAFQLHKDIADVDQLQWYYGAGAGVVLWNVDFGNNSTSVGIQGYLGLSYTFDGTPINVSADWIPTFFLNGLTGYGDGLNTGYGTIAVRYVLGGGSSS